MENDVHELKWKIVRQMFEIARLEDKVQKLEQELILLKQCPRKVVQEYERYHGY